MSRTIERNVTRVYNLMDDSGEWDHDLRDHAVRMTAKFCSNAFERIISRKISWTHWLILGVFADSGLDLLQCKCKPVLSSQVLGRIVFVLHLSEESSTSVATSKAEQKFVKNIFGVISQLPDYLHPSFNLRIHFFPLISNSQSCP
nr:hypothetical protein Iba_chr04dCG17440 [Ipomoea batatas]